MKAMKQKLRPMEVFMSALFFICGFIAIVFVLFISVYLIISGLPAIREIGLVDFLFGQEWASTAGRTMAASLGEATLARNTAVMKPTGTPMRMAPQVP